jgi:hypothetical protein
LDNDCASLISTVSVSRLAYAERVRILNVAAMARQACSQDHHAITETLLTTVRGCATFTPMLRNNGQVRLLNVVVIEDAAGACRV